MEQNFHGGITMLFMDAIIKRILEIKEEKHISLSKWSIKAGLTSSTLYDIVNGKSKKPTLNTFKRICDAIKMPLPVFFNVDYILSSECEDDFI